MKLSDFNRPWVAIALILIIGAICIGAHVRSDKRRTERRHQIEKTIDDMNRNRKALP